MQTPLKPRTVPLIKPDVPAFERIAPQLREVLESGRVTNFGKYVTQFEEAAGAFLGVPVVTTSSATAGLILTMQALGLERGQKVVVPSFTFVASAQAILYAGGVPLFVEVGDDLTMSPEDLEALLATHHDVAVVLPVHTYGVPCRVDELHAVVETAARRRGRAIPTVYDAAHGFGAALGERKVGGFGNAEVFSLSVTKLLVSVEGGMVASRDPELLRRLRKMRNYGIEENYDAHWPGLNGKMSELHAIVGLANLEGVSGYLAERKEKAAYFTAQIEAQTPFRVTPTRPNGTHTFKDFTIFVPAELKDQRAALMKLLGERGVETRAYFYPPVHEQRFFQRFADRALPVTEDLARRVITLPFYTTMGTGEMDHVVEALVEAQRELR